MAMSSGVKAAIGSVALFAVAVGGELLYLHHKRAADDVVPVAKDTYKSDPDDLVFLKKQHPDSLKDEKELKGKPIWVSAAGQMDYFPVKGGKVDFTKSEGVLAGAQELDVKDAVEQVVPKKAAVRIPAGDKQVLLVFTKPGGTEEYATPVGYYKDGGYTFLTDEIFFYDDPRTLFNYWGKPVWEAIDQHKVIAGMTERQAEMAIGQVATPSGDTAGERSMAFYNDGHPVTVVFHGGKATTITGQ